MVKKPRPSQSSKFTATWLSPRLQVSSKIVENSAHFERISQQKQRWRPPRGSSGHAYKKGDSSCQKTHYSGILQQTFSGSKTHESLATSNRSKYVKPSFTCTDIQDGNSRIYQEIDLKRGVGHLDRPHRRLFPCSNTSTISKISKISDQKRGFSVSSSSFWCRDSSPRVHSHCQRGQTHSSSQEPQNPSISGRLASSVTIKRSMSQRFGKVSSIGPRTRLAYQFSKIGIDTHAKTGFSGLSFRPSEGSSVPNPEETRSAKRSDCFHQKVISLDSKKAHVAHRDFSFLGKNSATRKVTHETFPVVPKVALEVSPVVGHKDSSNRKFPEAPKVVGGYQKSHGRCSYPSSGTQHTGVYRCLTKRLGSSLKRDSVKWSLVKQGSSAPHQCIGAKSCSSSPKGLSGTLTRSNSAHLFRQQHSSSLSEQRRRHTFHRDVCSYLENSCIHKFQKNPDKGKTRTWIPKRHSRLSITKGQGHTDGVVTSPTDIQPNLQSLAHTNGRSFCNSSKLQTSNLCISCPRQKGLENRCIEYLLGRPRRLCLLSSSHPATSNSKNNNIPMQDDSTGSRVARDAMVLGSGGSFDQGTPTAPSLEDTSEAATFQQVPQQRGVPESTCVASGFQESNSGRFSSEVAERIKAPQRESSRKVYQSRWTIYGQWCTENKVDITSTAVPQVAEFLNYLFTVKNLKPATITGYRTAIADALGSQGEFISKSLELNRLIASFTRDRPKPNRSIPTWDLSLVLLGLTKPPFEPLSEAPLKWLTYKTVFLLALASGKRRSEIHAWTHSSVSSRRNWSEVTVSPSPAFLAKNQLASDGPDSIKPVVIPALTIMLDSSLVEDKSLCPVRALKVYLEKTKSMRKGKALLFVSLREGYSKDITRITISQWIKHTIQTCYQSSDTADQQVTQVRAHDVRAMAASLAFKGGISLEQVLSSCYWKSHNTFTNFYLKDICWENDDIFKLGPIVSAQHVVNN